MMNTLSALKTLWHYHCVAEPPRCCDVLVGLGSYDERVARFCASLSLNGLAKVIVFTGRDGNWTRGRIAGTEARWFRNIATSLGVPSEGILLEEEATNIGENVSKTMALLQKRGLRASRIGFATKPQTTRRLRATLDIHAMSAPSHVMAPLHSFEEQWENVISFDEFANELVGDLERILKYPEQGFQSPQHVPEHVLESFAFLVAQGFTSHLLKR